uniref:hypothetical protein n=1 Tax=Algoriphagus sp. TaxID=1872435 RepID=UPI0025907477|nr:hypothetical protein [Algoriphagus sp.]
MNEFKIASKIYHDYSFKEGNQHIASEYNLYHILKYAKEKNVTKVLEIGTGIGTILSLFQEAKKEGFLKISNYIGTEANEFCLEQIQLNCYNHDHSDLNSSIVSDGSQIDLNGFELAIIDGKAPYLEQVVTNLLSENALILIEGYREDQVNRIKSVLDLNKRPYDYFMRFSTWRNPPYGPFHQKFQAGHTIFFLNPTKNDREFCGKMRRLARLRYHGRKVVNFRSLVKIIG